MRLQVAARGVSLSDALSKHIERKLGRLERLSTRIVKGQLTLERERGRVRGELILWVKRGVLVVRAAGGDAFEAVDSLRDRMAARLRRYEARWNPRRRP